MWHRPSRSATRPPSDPTFEEASVTPGSAARSSEAARSSTRSCEPTATIVRSISPTPRRSATSTVLARVVALEPGGHDEQAVGAHERGEHAGAARQRRRHELAADAAEPHAHPVVHAHRRGELAREPRAGARALGRRRALEGGQQRRGEDVERQRGRDRVAGRAEHRRARRPRRARPGGRAGPPRRGPRACPSRSTTARRVVVAPGARPGDRRSRGRRASRRRARRRAIASGSSGTISLRHAVAARPPRPAPTSMSELVSRITPGRRIACRPGGSRRRSGSTATTGRRRTSTSTAPAAAAAATSTGRSRWPVGQQQLGGADVLADRAHVLVGRDRGAQLGAPAVVVVDVLAHDDGVEAVGQRIAGVERRRRRRARAAPACSRSRRRSPRRARRCRPSPTRRTTARSASPTPARR